MSDLESQHSADKATPSPYHPPPAKTTQSRRYVPWRDRIKYFSWQWHGIVTATAVTSTIVHIFPYHNGSQALKIVSLVIFIFGVLVFAFNCVCKVVKAIMFPEDSLSHLTDPSKSAFSGFLAVGGAGLIDAGVNVSKDWGTGSNRFIFFLYGLWWLDAFIAYLTAFGVMYFILGQKSRDLGRVMAIWIIPVVALIASSTCGGLMASILAPQFPNLALITTGFALTMGLIGLSFTMMITFGFLLRLFLHGAPDAMTVLATFNTLTPLGQGGFSLLINGANLSLLMPNRPGTNFPQTTISGQLLYSLCFGAAYILWCMGIAWILMSTLSIARRVRKLPRFWVNHWCIVFPNGTFALLSVQLGNILESRFYHGFGAAWSIVVFIMWTSLFIRSIPAFIDGSMFVPPPPSKKKSKKRPRTLEAHHLPHHPHSHPHPHSNPHPTEMTAIDEKKGAKGRVRVYTERPAPEMSYPPTRPLAANAPIHDTERTLTDAEQIGWSAEVQRNVDGPWNDVAKAHHTNKME